MHLQTQITPVINLHINPTIPLKWPFFTFLMMMYQGCDEETLSFLTSLDLSAAFYTLERNILIDPSILSLASEAWRCHLFFYHFFAISHIGPFLMKTASTLTRCLVISRLDYCNSVFYNITQHQQTRLQRIMNKAARVVLNINTPDHPLHPSSKSCLVQLHWLTEQSRMTFKFQDCIVNFQISINL